MKENKITIIIDRPIEKVFEFTTNPKNTHLWITSIKEELADVYPPKIGTHYKNRGDQPNWNFYKVIEFNENKKFALSDLDENYYVEYTYASSGEKTKMEYFEWVKNGELKNPFTKEVLKNLKLFMENL